MNERDPYRDPATDNPNPPYRNPNLRQPGADPDATSQRPVGSRSTSTNWVWILAGAVLLVAVAAYFMMGQPIGPNEPSVTGTIPQTERPMTTPVEPAAPERPGGVGGAPATAPAPAPAPVPAPGGRAN